MSRVSRDVATVRGDTCTFPVRCYKRDLVNGRRKTFPVCLLRDRTSPVLRVASVGCIRAVLGLVHLYS